MADSGPSIDNSADDLARDQIIQEIASLAGVRRGRTVDEFWYQMGLLLKVRLPAEGAIKAAQQVFGKLGEAWDDDYVNEAGTSLSIEAYETLYEALRAAPPQGAATQETTTDEDKDDEDDSIGDLAASFNYEARTTQTDIDTLVGRIDKGLLVLSPAWQRNFVWKLKKQRRLVESILLGLPIPSLLLFRESKDGITYVIDGRQRLETIARFRTPKKKAAEAGARARFKTFPASTEGWSPGAKLHPAAGKYYDDLPQTLKTQFDQAPLVLHTFVGLPREKLYQIFRRYNTGAEQLRAAEIRNAVYQASSLHEMMYRLAGEHGDNTRFANAEERKVAATLDAIMKNKVARYGRYDFIGRYFAFSYMSKGSVATAINDFMAAKATADMNELRDEFVRVFNTTREWYEYFLTPPSPDGKFHAFLSTIQMVSCRHMLFVHVDKGHTNADAVKTQITEEWPDFAESVLEDKQNSTNFWHYQTDWIRRLESKCTGPATSNA